MKKFLGILVLGLLLITPSQADDIRDFQIEGMSVGDSALNFFSEQEIKINQENWYKNKKFTPSCASDETVKEYDSFCFDFKTEDKEKKFYHLTGMIYMDIEKCNNKKDEIVNEISDLMKETRKSDEYTSKHEADKSGESTVTAIDFMFISGDYITVECHDWSERMTREKGWDDHLRVSIKIKEFNDFLYIAF